MSEQLQSYDNLQEQYDQAVAGLQQRPFGRKLLEIWGARPKPGDDFATYDYQDDQELIAFAEEALGAASADQVFDLFESMVGDFRLFELNILKAYKEMRLAEIDKEYDGDRVSKNWLKCHGSDPMFHARFHLFQVRIHPAIMSREAFVPGLPSGEQLRVVRLAGSIHRRIEQIQNPSGLDPYDEFA